MFPWTRRASETVGRVLVPFRQQRMTGIVMELHDREPAVVTKKLLAVLDIAPVLDDQLLRLGRWIADYYLAPLGEVFRTMLPLNAEFKRAISYRITDAGQTALHLASTSGIASGRSMRTRREQAAEFRVLDYLANRLPEEMSAFAESRFQRHDQGRAARPQPCRWRLLKMRL